jgi:hypothetical protein
MRVPPRKRDRADVPASDEKEAPAGRQSGPRAHSQSSRSSLRLRSCSSSAATARSTGPRRCLSASAAAQLALGALARVGGSGGRRAARRGTAPSMWRRSTPLSWVVPHERRPGAMLVLPVWRGYGISRRWARNAGHCPGASSSGGLGLRTRSVELVRIASRRRFAFGDSTVARHLLVSDGRSPRRRLRWSRAPGDRRRGAQQTRRPAGRAPRRSAR